MTNQSESFDQEIDTEHYTGIKLFSTWGGVVLLALGFWYVVILGLFSLKGFAEYLIGVI